MAPVGHSSGSSVIVEASRRLPTSVIGVVGVDTWPNLEQPLTTVQVAETLAPYRTSRRTTDALARAQARPSMCGIVVLSHLIR